MHESQSERLESYVKMTIAICAVGSVLSCCGTNETNQLWKPSRLRPALSFPDDAPNSAVPVLPAIGSFVRHVGVPDGHDAARRLAQQREVVLGDAHLADDLRLRRVDDLALRVDDLLQEVRLVEGAPLATIA
jgi:hypothetical protein